MACVFECVTCLPITIVSVDADVAIELSLFALISFLFIHTYIHVFITQPEEVCTIIGVWVV